MLDVFKMEGHAEVLPKPSQKEKVFLRRNYPFPILRDKDNEGSADAVFKCFIGYLQSDCVLVMDQDSMAKLYNMGFFGKGTLSKSAPKFCKLVSNAEEDSRQNRTEYQSEEENSQSSSENNAESRKRNELSCGDSFSRESKRKKVDSKAKVNMHSSVNTSAISTSETNKTDSKANQNVTESLQLTFEEAFFLSYGLGCLVIMDKEKALDLTEAWQKFCELSPDSRFPIMYTAYHHFRSKGWVVRSGLKYGTDFVLYKDGPPFYHSTYSVIVKTVKENNLKETAKTSRMTLTWASLAALNRVNSNAAKAILILYVIKPDMMSENKISTPFCISQFKVQEDDNKQTECEILVKRWVSAAGREEES